MSFVIVFSSLFILNEVVYYTSELYKKQHDFFSTELYNNNTVFIIGSSHIGMLNSSYIHENLSNYGFDYAVYNLAYNGDKPSKRENYLSELISMKPKLIVYGVGYRDMSLENSANDETLNSKQAIHEKILPDPKQIIHEVTSTINYEKFEQINPRILLLTTLSGIKNVFTNSDNQGECIITQCTNFFYQANTPFMSFEITDKKILNDEELRSDPEGNPIIYHIDPSYTNLQVRSMSKIVETIQKNNIKLVIVSTPLHKEYLDTIPITEKDNFNLILQNLEDEYDIKIYDLSHKYQNLSMWKDYGHVAINQSALLYSEDISKIIFTEIEK